MKKLKIDPLLVAARDMDWVQVVLNGGPPCFHLEDGRFCGRAERWAGHEDGDPHKFVSLHALIALVRDCGTYNVMEAMKTGPKKRWQRKVKK